MSTFTWKVGPDEFYFINAPAQGSCFCQTISYGLASYGIYQSHLEIRSNICAKLKELDNEQPAWLQDWIQAQMRDEFKNTFTAYANAVADTNFWLGTFEMPIVALIYGTDIEFICWGQNQFSNGTIWVQNHHPNVLPPLTKLIRMAFVRHSNIKSTSGGNHYGLLLPKNQTFPTNDVQAFRQWAELSIADVPPDKLYPLTPHLKPLLQQLDQQEFQEKVVDLATADIDKLKTIPKHRNRKWTLNECKQFVQLRSEMKNPDDIALPDLISSKSPLKPALLNKWQKWRFTYTWIQLHGVPVVDLWTMEMKEHIRMVNKRKRNEINYASQQRFRQNKKKKILLQSTHATQSTPIKSGKAEAVTPIQDPMILTDNVKRSPVRRSPRKQPHRAAKQKAKERIRTQQRREAVFNSQKTWRQKKQESIRVRQTFKSFCADTYDSFDETQYRNYVGEDGNLTTLFYAGARDRLCPYCDALMWEREESSKSKPGDPSYTLCCQNGKIKLKPYRPPPEYLHLLFTREIPDSKTFHKFIRALNNNLAFASYHAREERMPPGPPTIRVQGAVYHRTGGLKIDGSLKFAQIYFHDTEHELENRLLHAPESRPIDYDAILKRLQVLLHKYNPHVKAFKRASTEIRSSDQEYRLILHADPKKRRGTDRRRYNTPQASEVAILIRGSENGLAQPWDIVLRSNDNALRRIPYDHKDSDALAYPLLFPYGDMGLSREMRDNGISFSNFYAYHLMERQNVFNQIHWAGRLGMQFVCCAGAKAEQVDLDFIASKKGQEKIRADVYKGVQDALQNDDVDNAGRRIILPSTRVGSPRYMNEKYQNAMSIVRKCGKPDLLITMTCNGDWKEIKSELKKGMTSSARADIVCRVFKMKVDQLINYIKEGQVFGRVIGLCWVIEFQKRCLPHCHILVILAPEDKFYSCDDYDRYVSAEIPDKSNPTLRDYVLKFMIHKPCGKYGNMNAPCVDERGLCEKRFPKKFSSETKQGNDSYPQYRRRSPEHGGDRIHRRGVDIDNQWVVPYNAALLLAFGAHINVEIAATVDSVKYLYKYVYKGVDRAMYTVEKSDVKVEDAKPKRQLPKNEVKAYLDCRYYSHMEAVWHIFNFKMQHQYPHVIPLSLHMPEEEPVVWDSRRKDKLAQILDRSKYTMLTEYFEITAKEKENPERGKSGTEPAAFELTYDDFPSHYTWHKDQRIWTRKKSPDFTIGRVYRAHPKEGERFYLRRLLFHVKGPTSFEDVRTVRNELCPSFKESCIKLGLLEDDSEWDACMAEAAMVDTPGKLRNLFVTILMNCNPQNPRKLWETHKNYMSEKYLYQHRKRYRNMNLPYTDEIYNRALLAIEQQLIMLGSSMEAHGLPIPVQISSTSDTDNPLIWEETQYNTEYLQSLLEKRMELMTDEQRAVFDTIKAAISNPAQQNFFFIDAPGGTGKTFVLESLLAEVRQHSEVALAVGSSGIAALLLTGGRTVHFTFKVPIAITSESTCYLPKRKNYRSELIKVAKLIVWDEAPMQDKKIMEAVDRTLRDIRSSSLPFGGVVVVMAGDFRQTLPILPREGRGQIVAATLRCSSLWKHVHTFHLTQNMRVLKQLQQKGNPKEAQMLQKFTDYLMRIGNGEEKTYPELGEDTVRIPDEFVSKCQSLSEFIDTVYPNLSEHATNMTLEDFAGFISTRALLAPKNIDVETVNEMVLSKLPGKVTRTYLSADRVADEDNTNLYPPEFLNTIKDSGVPDHKLSLKLRMPIILLRNLNASLGACNGTRMIVTGMYDRIIRAMVVTGTHAGKTLFIPRVSLNPKDSKFPFKLWRRQIPVRAAGGLTINKSQGQTLLFVGVFLPNAVFAHGQLYVAFSRVPHPNGLSLFFYNDEKNKHGFLPDHQGYFTRNVVYPEVLEK